MARSSAGLALLARPGIEVVAGDLLAPDAPDRLQGLLAGAEVVVHAATAIPRNDAAPGAWDTTARLRTEGTQRLLAAASAAGARGYIQQSIVTAYPDGGDRWLDESTPIDPAPARASICVPVAAMEALVRAVDVAHLRWCILRGGFFLGPGTFQDLHVERLRAGRPIVGGDGRAFFSPVHVADMAADMVAAVERLPGGATFNVAATPLRWGAYVARLARLLGVPPPPRPWPGPPSPSCRCTSAAARTVLGWTPQRTIWPAGQGGGSPHWPLEERRT
jgi:nucleoside-diphosphate-sugar epimerase